MNRSLLALTAGMLLMGTAAAQAQTQSPNLNDDTQMLLSQIQADKAAVVLKSLELTDPEARAFTPIYDEYQKERNAARDGYEQNGRLQLFGTGHAP